MVVTLVLAAVALRWSSSDTGGPLVAGPSEPESIPQPGLEVAPVSSPAVPPAARQGVGAPQPELLAGEVIEPPRSLAGRVKGRLGWQVTGLPLPGVVVRAVRAWPDTVLINDIDQQSEDRPPLRRADLFVGEPATTDPFGLFEVAVPEVDGPLALLALRNGQCIEVRPLQPGPAAREVIELGDWLLQPRGEVRGRVVDPRGRAVFGARVRLVDVPLEAGASLHPLARAARLYGARDFARDCLVNDQGRVVAVSSTLSARDDMLPFPETTTDAHGDFVLSDARPGVNTLVVQPETAPNLSEQVLVQGGVLTDVGSLQVLDARLVGRLVDDKGRAIARGEVAFLALDSDLMTPPVATDAEGAFSVCKLAQAPLRAVARRSGSEPWQACGLEAERDGWRLTLAVHRRQVINVLAPDGSPKSDCRVEVRHALVFGLGFDAVSVVPEVGEGLYAANLPALVASLLVVRADGFAPLVGGLGGRDPEVVRLRLRTFALRVQVRDRDGEPAPRTQVYARVRSNPAESLEQWGMLRPGHVRLGETDEHGELACDGMWPSTVEFVAFHPRLGAAERTVPIAEPAPTCELVLGDSTRSRLRGVLAENRLPPRERWLVVAQRVEPPAMRRTTLSETDGTFAFDGLQAGVWRLDLEVRAGSPDARSMVAGLQSSYARRGWSIAEHRVDLIAGVPHHIDIEIRRWVDDARRQALTGVVRVDGLVRSGLSVELHRQLDRDEEKRQQRIDELVRSLSLPAAWRSRVQAASELYVLRRRQHFENPVAIALTDDTGAFAFETAETQRVDVTAHVDGFERCLWSGEQVSGAVIDIRTGSALVEVRAARGELLAHRTFVAEGQGSLAGVRVPAVADRMGVLSFAGIPCGEYALRALSRGSTLTFSAPAFAVTGPDWRRASAIAR